MQSKPFDGRILMLVKRFTSDRSSRWLTDELADAFIEQGAVVEVALLDLAPRSAKSFESRSPIVVRRYSPSGSFRRSRSLLRRSMSLIGCETYLHVRELSRAVRHRYECVVVFSIASFFGLVPVILRRAGLTRSLVFVLWDFFPDHHVEIGVVPRRARRVMRPLERWVAKTADVVCVMSEAGATAAVEYFGVDPERLVVQAPWGDALTADERAALLLEQADPHPSKSSALHLVFGGQAGKGRDLEWLVDQIVEANGSGSGSGVVKLSVVGTVSDGLVRHLAQVDAESQFIEIVPWMKRDDYLAFLSTADVGVVVTDGRVRFPTFPSKLVDYFRVGLPVLACLEDASDVGALVEAEGMGVACQLGSQTEFEERIAHLVDAKQQRRLDEWGGNARLYFNREMDVQVAAARIFDAVLAVHVPRVEGRTEAG